nr:pentapeptide repeat-containing protein [Nostoc commune]
MAANLQQANLSYANLEQADLKDTNLDGAIFYNTIMPAGTIKNE